MQHLSWQRFSILEISQLLLNWFWPSFKGRFLGPSLTDAIKVIFVQATYVLATFVHISNISAHPILTKLLGLICLGALIFFGSNIIWPKYLLDQYFCCTFLDQELFLDPKFLGPKILIAKNFLTNSFRHLNLFGPFIVFISFGLITYAAKITKQQYNYNGFWHNWN